ncbi:glycosyltransferase family 4 protein [Brachybacterium sp. NBEC-018]|uniref:glycosyltransferase family 4 protein n=1 Tax=Brachybacterium sp. NBEC-018 TaxID=2996004 RepID=UPI00217542C8|nr:glycosyltransferase family 4 protein [Brachybacterium sp. NBEC-018]UVY84836.1 glycosyltransferase family 4 protein [Brachybacterium sp. NBEC-018]
MNPTALAIATNNGDLGGGEIMLLRIARALRALGVEPLVLTSSTPGDLAAAAREEGLAVTELECRGRRGYAAALLRWRLAHRDLPLWCNGLLPATATAGIGPRIVHLHRVPSSRGQRAAARLAAVGARQVVVPSELLARLIPGARVLPNWTDDLTLRADAPLHVPARIGFLGRLTEEKGADVLARAVEILLEQGRDLRLVVAGEARFAADGDGAAQALARLGDRVELLGWTSPQELLDQVDVAAFPSVVPESFGMVAAEAMGAGTPFVVSDAGALPEVVGTGHPYVARAGDAEDLARQIARALDASEDEQRTATSAARSRWEQRYSPAAGRDRVRALLRACGAPFPVPQEKQA